MKQSFRRLSILVALVWALGGAVASAQVPVSAYLSSTTCPGTGCVLLGVQSMGSAAIQIEGTGTWTAAFEGSVDGGPFVALTFSPSDGGDGVTTATGEGLWIGNVAGVTQLRVRLSAYTSGTPRVHLASAPSGGGGGGAGGTLSGTITCSNCSGSGVSVNEDVASANADPGTPAYAVRKATPANTSGADGDYEALQVANGRLWTTATIDSSVLPTGASTAAKQPALGTAGSASSDVITVQGVASMTPFLTTTTLAAETTKVIGSVNLDLGGTALTGGAGAVGATTLRVTHASDDPAVTALQLIDNMVSGNGLNVTQMNGVNVTMGNGVSGTGVQRVAIASDSTGAVRLQDGSGNAITSNANGGSQALNVVVYDASGNAVTAFSGSGGTASNFTSAFPSAGTAAGFTDGTNMLGARVVDADTGAGTFYAQAVNNVFRTSGTPVEAGTSANPWNVVFPSAQAVTVSTITTLSQLGGVALPIEDAAETAAGVGIYAMTVRRDTAASSAGTTGDNATLNTDANGRLWASATIDAALPAGNNNIGDVDIASGTITTVATVTSLSQLGGVALPAEDSAETANGVGIYAMSVRRDTMASSAGTTGDNATVNTDANGRLWITGTALEDVASASGDQGLTVLAVRSDSLAASSGTTGDYEVFHTNANGALWTIDVNSAALLTSTQLIDDIVGVEDAAETAGGGLAMAGTVRRDTAASSAGTTGDNATLNTDSLGRLWVTGAAVEDAAETAGGLLVMGGSVRRDTAASSAGTTGDNATLNTDAVGALWVNPFSQTQAATTYLTMRLSDGTNYASLATDATHDATAATTGPQMMAELDDSSPDAVDEGDAGRLRISANRNLYTTLRDAAGNERGANVTASNELLVNCGNCTGSGASAVDDAAFGVASGTVAPAGFLFDDVAPDSVNEGDVGIGRMSANRNQYVTLRDAAGNERGLNIDSSGAVAVTIAAAGVTGNPAFNTQQWGGSTATGGAGAVAAGTPRVTLASDDPAVATLAALARVEDVAETAGGSGIYALTVRRDTVASSAGTAGDNSTLNTDANGRLWTIADITVNGGTALSATSNALNVNLSSGGAALPVEDAAETAGATGIYAMGVRRDTPASSAGTTGDNTMPSFNNVGAMWTSMIDPCSSEAKTTDPFSLTARGVIIAAAASKKTYICGITIVAGVAEIVNIDEGTGTTCQTGTAALVGSTTAANGLSLAANGGFAAIGGNSTVIAGKTANVDTCIVPSSTNRIAGFVTWVQR